MAQMVRSESDLVAVLRLAPRHRHDPGIAHEQVEAGFLGQDGLGRLLDRVEGGQITARIDTLVPDFCACWVTASALFAFRPLM
jgi:hypothetical protein